jgi:T-complex protein 1 subunit delta
VVAGDGTTSVTVLCGALLSRCLGLLDKGVHPTLISQAFQLACDKAVEVVRAIAEPVDLKDKEALIDAAMTCAPSSICTCLQN